MMKKTGLSLAILCSFTLLSACSDSNNKSTSIAEGTQIDLRLLETTDIHANLVNYNYFTDKQDDKVGLVKTAGLIRQARGEVVNSVLVDNGDLLQGSPLGDYVAKIKTLAAGEVHPVYAAMNTLDYDVANIGNHEFNFGLPFLNEAVNDANFPYISANVFIDDGDDDATNDQPLFQPYLIQEKQVKDNNGELQTIKIGYIGFVPPQIMQWDKANLEGKVIAKDILLMAQKYVPKMKSEGADVIIAIPHSGLDIRDHQSMAENSTYYLSQVPDIDAILFGHSHANFPGKNYADLEGMGIDNEKGTINGVAAVMPGFWGNHLGVVDLTLDYRNEQWLVSDASAHVRAIYQTDEDRNVQPLVDNDNDVEQAVMAVHDETKEWVNQPFAKISKPINSYFALVNDDPSIQVVTDAQAWYTAKIVQGTELADLPILSAGAPFRAGRGGADDFTQILAGDIAYRNVADLYIYPNVLKVLKLSGAEVKEWLEMSAGQFNQITPESDALQTLINPQFPSYNFDVIDGVSYQIDVSQPARYSVKGEKISDGQRIKNLSFDGQPIDLNAHFLVVSNNYRASGGGNFPNINADKIVIDAPDENRQVVADYLMFKTAQNPAQGFDPSADQNWQFAPMNNVSVQFGSANHNDAVQYSEGFDHISQLERLDDNGFALYQLDLSER